jgi:hypothetical protein
MMTQFEGHRLDTWIATVEKDSLTALAPSSATFAVTSKQSATVFPCPTTQACRRPRQPQAAQADLLRGPRPVRVRGDPGDVDVAAADFDHEQAVQPLERQCAVHVEEVGGKHRRGLRAQELPPGCIGVPLRRRGYLQRLEDPPDRGRAGPVAGLKQFALDPLIAPAVVLGGESLDERCDLGADRREIPTTPDSRKKVLKTVAAFASGEGGTVIFGVSDDAQPVGLDPAALDWHMLTVSNMLFKDFWPVRKGPSALGGHGMRAVTWCV